jgi:hypothetical protein
VQRGRTDGSAQAVAAFQAAKENEP